MSNQMAIQVIYYNLQENKKNRTGKNAYISMFVRIVKKKAKRKSPTHGGVKQKEGDFHFLLLIFFSAMCRACIQFSLKRRGIKPSQVARYGLVPDRRAKSVLFHVNIITLNLQCLSNINYIWICNIVFPC